MKIRTTFLLAATLFACNNNDPYTWEEAYSEVVTAYCEKLDECGYLYRGNVDVCVEHAVFHECAYGRDCSTKFPDAGQATLLSCVEAINAIQDDSVCYFTAYYGLLPTECAALSEYRP